MGQSTGGQKLLGSEKTGALTRVVITRISLRAIIHGVSAACQGWGGVYQREESSGSHKSLLSLSAQLLQLLTASRLMSVYCVLGTQSSQEDNMLIGKETKVQ